MKKEIAVIIPNYNGEDLIKTCVNYLEDQNYKDFKIIVVDDGSTDKSREIIKKLPVELIENKENSGFAYSVNQGIKASDTDFVLLLNNDVFIKDPSFLETMVNTIKSDPKIFSVSPKMIQYRNPDLIDDTGDEYTLFGWTYKRGDNESITKYTEDTTIFSTCAGAGLYRRDVFDQIGLFDENHFAYLEDVDVGWRAQIEGYYNIYSAHSQCYHLGSATFTTSGRYSSFKVYLSARNNIFIIYKNMPLAQILFNLPFLVAGFLIKTVYFYHYGFGSDYLKGLSEGFKNLGSLKKVEFNKKNIANYIRIEKEMIRSTITYTQLKGKKVLSKLLGMVRGKLVGEQVNNNSTAKQVVLTE